MRRFAPLLLTVTILLLVLATGLLVTSKSRSKVSPVAVASCSSLDVPVRQSVDLRTGSTTFAVGDGVGAASGGAAFDRGFPFAVATAAGPGLVAVHLLESVTSDRVYSPDVEEIARFRARGYADRGTAFFVLGAAQDCAAPVYRMEQGGRHQFSASGNVRADLRAEGWRDDGVAFFAVTSAAQAPRPATTPAPAAVVPVSAGTFSIAVMPDTQQEVLSADDSRLADRSRWLVANKTALDLRFVAHVGDLVNWDTPDHGQYDRARAALRVLNEGRLPYAIAPGNHDGQATCEGGSACPGVDVPVALRDTRTFNRYFPPTAFSALGGEFEAGKADNAFHTFSAEGKKFLVLALEMGARPTVLRWAESVVASHPRHNVIVLTHYYLTATGQIAQASTYGDGPPTDLYAKLVRPYPNVKVVLSGHVGTGAVRQDPAAAGAAVSFLQCFHDNETNPVRVLQIDVAGGSISSTVIGPATAVSYPALATPPMRISWI